MQQRVRRLILALLVVAQIVGLVAFPVPVRSLNLSPLVKAALPRDLVNHWASDTFAYWMDQGVLAGYADGTARPDDLLSVYERLGPWWCGRDDA